jgi:hypothetical protein
MSVRTLGWALVLLLSAIPARAQLVIPGAGEDKFGLIDGGYRTVTVTTADDAVSFNWSTKKYKTKGECNGLTDHSPELVACLMSLRDEPLSMDFALGVTGEKGKGAILSKGLFNPGATFKMAVNYRLEPSPTDGYTDFYGTFSTSITQLHIASMPEGGMATIDDGAEKKFGFSGGVNRFFNEHFGVGGAATVTRALSTPGLRDPITICDTVTAPGAEDHVIEASDCQDGFVAPMADQWIRTLRGDVLYNFDRVKRTPAGPKAVVTFGMIGSVNVAYRTGTPTTGNIAFGPVLHPKGIPNKAILALVVKLSDVTNAITGEKTWKERTGAVLWFGIPLTGF